MKVKMNNPYPVKSKEHNSSAFDSTRWNHYQPRQGDTVISTYAKCGTTWMEHIVLNLHHCGQDIPRLGDVSAWIERHTSMQSRAELPVEELIEWMENLSSPRQIKTHLPLDYLPYHAEVKYLVVSRDMRDAYLSWHHHLQQTGESQGEDLHAFWLTWVEKGIAGNAPTATDDTAHPHFEFYDNWWPYRELDNIHLVHFNNLLGNLRSEIESIADFLEIEVDHETVNTITQATTFASMKENSQQLLGKGQWMIHKGTNGRWKEILTNADLVLYERAKAKAIRQGIAAECLKWLETGQIAA
jgi:aryl sulfotransferase